MKHKKIEFHSSTPGNFCWDYQPAETPHTHMDDHGWSWMDAAFDSSSHHRSVHPWVDLSNTSATVVVVWVLAHPRSSHHHWENQNGSVSWCEVWSKKIYSANFSHWENQNGSVSWCKVWSKKLYSTNFSTNTCTCLHWKTGPADLQPSSASFLWKIAVPGVHAGEIHIEVSPIQFDTCIYLLHRATMVYNVMQRYGSEMCSQTPNGLRPGLFAQPLPSESMSWPWEMLQYVVMICSKKCKNKCQQNQKTKKTSNQGTYIPHVEKHVPCPCSERRIFSGRKTCAQDRTRVMKRMGWCLLCRLLVNALPPPPYTRLIKIVEEPPCRQFFVPFRWTRNSAAFFLGDTQKTHNKKQKMNEESLAATQKSDETRTSFTAAGSFRLLSRHWNRVCRRMQQDRFVPNGNFEMCGMQNMITASIHHHSPSKFACQKNHAQTKMPTLRSHRS